MDFFALDWSVGDDPKTERCIVTAHGKTLDGLAVCARIAFFPYFFVEVPSTWSLGRQKLLVTEAVTRYGAVQQYSLPVQRKSLWGFTNGEERPFVQLAFPSIRLSRRARQVAKNEWRMKTFEADIDPLVRLLHMRSLPPAGWVHISAFTEVPPDTDARVSRADVEVTALFSALHASSVAAPPPLVIASWDIECYSATRNFPLSHNEDDAIVCIGVTFQRADAPEPYLRTAICLGETGDVEGAEVVSVPAEHDVINEFFELLGREKVDFLVGWNTHNFDWRYVDGRAAVLHDDAGDPQVASGLLGRMLEGGGKAVERELSSAAYGSNSFLELGTPGIAQADLMQVFKREHKLDSYSLNAVSQRFLDNSCKIDLPASEMFRCFEGGPADRARLAEYCLRDTELPLRLMWRMSTLSNLLEMANATSVPLAYILNRGQQIKVFSLVTRKARELGFLVPDNEGIPADGEKYEGATVLSAERGAYFEPVSALDFASLYPSIMRAWNFCYSTLVLDDAKYGSVPGVEYHTCETGLGTFKYAQKVPSVLPALLEDLAKYRKAAKKLMAEAKAAGNAHLAGLYNGQQLAHKISMNSVYGFCGASKGFLACVPLAASTTAMGRSMIAQTKRLAEELVPGSRVIYGDTDSVMVLLAVEDSKKDDLEEHFRVAEDLAAKISATFPSPICLEFEKIYWPYLLFSKKVRMPWLLRFALLCRCFTLLLPHPGRSGMPGRCSPTRTSTTTSMSRACSWCAATTPPS